MGGETLDKLYQAYYLAEKWRERQESPNRIIGLYKVTASLLPRVPVDQISPSEKIAFYLIIIDYIRSQAGQRKDYTSEDTTYCLYLLGRIQTTVIQFKLVHYQPFLEILQEEISK